MNYGASTQFPPQQVLDLADSFFGPQGVGLHVVERGGDYIDLAGPRGRVSVRVTSTAGTNEVFLTSDGLDESVRRFLVQVYEA